MGATASTLLGVGLGASLTGAISYGSAAISFKRDKGERRRAERIVMISQFQRHVDELWRSRQDVGVAVMEILGNKQDADAWARRNAAFEEARPARHEATLLLAQMRLLAPDLVPSAESLLEISERSDQMKYGENLKARKTAQAAFETVARRFV